MTFLAPYEKSKVLGSRGSMVVRLGLREIDGRAAPSDCSGQTTAPGTTRALEAIAKHKIPVGE